MKILLAWLSNFVWVIYAGCGLGAVISAARALALQRRLGISLTTFERETTAAHAARLWRIALTFVLVGVVLILGHVYLLPQVVPAEGASATPTLAGLVTATPQPPTTATPLLGVLPTITATIPAPPPPSPPSPPTPTPVAAEPAPAYPLSVRLGDVAELLGYDLAATEVSPSQTVALTLYWRALEGAGATNYTVFTHLLRPDFLTNAEGALVAQHDSVPSGGERPTLEWLPGEVIADYHELVLLDAGFSGAARIAVGLYDAVTMARVGVEGGTDYVLLPTEIAVVAP